MAPLAATAIANSADDVYQMALGIGQHIKAGKINRRTKRPKYSIPGKYEEAEALLRSYAMSSRMPGQTIAEENIRGSAASAGRAIKEAGVGGAEKLAAMAGVNSATGKEFRDLHMSMLENKNRSIDRLSNMMRLGAQYQEKGWEWNKQKPFIDAMETVNRLRDAGHKNVHGAISGAASSFGSYMGGKVDPTAATTTPATTTPATRSAPSVQSIATIPGSMPMNMSPNPRTSIPANWNHSNPNISSVPTMPASVSPNVPPRTSIPSARTATTPPAGPAPGALPKDISMTGPNLMKMVTSGNTGAAAGVVGKSVLTDMEKAFQDLDINPFFTKPNFGQNIFY